MTRIKICGVTETAHALAAAEAGACMVGFVFAPSRRRVELERARQIVRDLKTGYPSVQAVGLFVNRPADEMNRIADKCGLDIVQLSGDEPWDVCRQVKRPAIKAVRAHSGADVDSFLVGLEDGIALVEPERVRLLVDAHVEGSYGGTGIKADWDVAALASRRFPILLAGGLTPENVGEAVRQVRPWGVDVSSGVETDGIKDLNKIWSFIQAVRRVDEDLGIAR